MAIGYLIAAVCEIAGVIGVAVALVTMRAERRAKALELRSFLRSGQSALVAPPPPVPSRRRVQAARAVSLPLGQPRPHDAAVAASAARAALQRAVMR